MDQKTPLNPQEQNVQNNIRGKTGGDKTILIPPIVVFASMLAVIVYFLIYSLNPYNGCDVGCGFVYLMIIGFLSVVDAILFYLARKATKWAILGLIVSILIPAIIFDIVFYLANTN